MCVSLWDWSIFWGPKQLTRYQYVTWIFLDPRVFVDIQLPQCLHSQTSIMRTSNLQLLHHSCSNTFERGTHNHTPDINQPPNATASQEARRF